MGWMLVRRYQNESAARKIYEAARDLLFTRDLDASVLRFTIDGVSHVVVLGEEPLNVETSEVVETLLDESGEHSDIPELARDQLRLRRRSFKSTGADYFERRTTFIPPHQT